MECRLPSPPESLNLCTDRLTLSQLETIYKPASDPLSATPCIRSLSSIFRNSPSPNRHNAEITDERLVSQLLG